MNSLVHQIDRYNLNTHKSALLLFTGLPASGKTTLAYMFEKHLYEIKVRSYVLDGDLLRSGLCMDLGFSKEDRTENLRRVSEIGSILVDAGLIVLAAFISPLEKQRQMFREKLKDKYIEVYVKCSINECMRRDPKGLYKKAQQGLIPNFTGITDPYEVPANPDLVLDTEILTVNDCISSLTIFLDKKGLLRL